MAFTTMKNKEHDTGNQSINDPLFSISYSQLSLEYSKLALDTKSPSNVFRPLRV